MKYRTIIIITIVLIIVITAGIIISKNPSITGNIIIEEYTYTKALCNETNFCQDYIITCENKTPKSIVPISGAIIQHTENWEDPRDDSSLC